MTDFLKHSGNNVGGIIEVNYISKRSVLSISEMDEDYSVTVELKTGAAWSKFYGTYQTIKFNQKHSKVDAGDLFEQNLSLWLPQDREEVVKELSLIKDDRFIYYYKDMNGKYKLIGSIENPVIITTQLNVEEQLSGDNGNLVTFVRKDKDYPPFLKFSA